MERTLLKMKCLTFLLLLMTIIKLCTGDLGDVTSEEMLGDDLSLSMQGDDDFSQSFFETTRSISSSTLARSTTPGPITDFMTSPFDVLKKGPTNEPVLRVSRLFKKMLPSHWDGS